MDLIKTNLADVYIVKNKVFNDERGNFLKVFIIEIF